MAELRRPSPGLLVCTLVLVLGLSVGVSVELASAQEDASTSYSLGITSTFVQVPISVYDSDGNPVMDLTAEDFRILDEGDEQKITQFETIDLNQPSARQDVLAVPSSRRSFLFLFDLAFTTLNGLKKAREAAIDFVDTGLGPADLAGVATYTASDGLRLQLSFTSDRQQLKNAIEGLGLQTAERTQDPLALTYDLSGAGGTGQSRQGVDFDSVLEAHLQSVANMMQKASKSSYEAHVKNLVGNVAGLGQTLDHVPGRKHVIFMSAGFDNSVISGGTDMASIAESMQKQEQGEIWEVDMEDRLGSSEVRSGMAEALSGFQRSDAVVHTIDVRGLTADTGVATDKRGSGQHSLSMIASETGGQLYKDTNDLRQSLEQIVDRTGQLYVLGFTPSDIGKPGAYHKLKVDVESDRRGLDVVHRAGYYAPEPYEELEPIERQLNTGALIMSGVTQDDITLNPLVSPFDATTEGTHLSVFLEAPKLFDEASSDDVAALQVFGYAVGEDGELGDYFEQNLGLNRTKLPERLSGAGLKYYGVLTVPPGSYSVRLLMRDLRSGKTGVVTVPVDAPNFDDSKPHVGKPLIIERETAWIPARHPKTEKDPTLYPFAVGGNTFFPAGQPLLANQQATLVYVPIYNVADLVSSGKLRVTGQIIDKEDGSPVSGADISVQGQAPDPGDSKLTKFVLQVTPKRVRSGDYLLQIKAEDLKYKSSWTSEAPISIR